MAGVHFKVTGDANGYIAATRQAEAATGKMVGSITDEAKKIDNIFKTLATSASAVFTLQMASQFSKQVAIIRGQFQQLEVAFETMLQSKEKADALMAQVVDTAAKTPFDLQGVANGAKQLLAYGVASEEVNDTLIRLGDIAAGLSIPLNDLVYLYGTTMTQGRLFTQDLRQFQGRGIPLADELAKQFGVAKDKVGELVTAGKVGFPEVQKAIMAMTNEGGKFANLMAKQSKTITGQISNLQDAVDQMFNDIGKASEGAISGAIGLASSLVENYEKVGRLIGGIVTAFGAYKAAVIALNAVEKARTSILAAQAVAQRAAAVSAKQVTAATVLWTRAQKALNASMLTNPYVLAAAAVAALGVGIYALVTAKSKEEKAFERVNGQLKSYQDNLEKQKQQLQELFNTMNDSNSTEMQRVLAMEQLRELYPSVLKGLSDEELLKLSVAEATKELAKQEEALYKSNLLKQIADKTAEYEKQLNVLRTGGYGGLLGAASSKKQERDVEALRYELELLLQQYNDLEAATKKADFLALPADQKIISLKESNAQLDTEIAELDKKLKELHDKKNQAAAEQPQEFRLGSLSGALYDGEMTEDQILAEIKARQQQKALNDKDIAENQAEVDANNKVLSDKQKKANYDRQKAEEKAAKDLIKMKRDLNNRVAQADIDSMEDGYAKTIRQLKHNLELENQAIEQQKEDLLKRKENDALQSWLAEDPENRKAYDFKFDPTLSQDEEALFQRAGELAQRRFNDGKIKADKQYEKEAEFFQKQLSIDAMSHGTAKDEAQRQLDNEKELHSLELQRQAYIEAARAAHLFAVAKGEATGEFDEGAANASFDKIVSDTQARQQKDQLDELKLKYEDFAQAVTRIDQDLARDLSKMRKDDGTLVAGFSQENVDNAIKAAEDAKDAIAVSMASIDSSFDVFIGSLADKTIDELELMLAQAKTELTTLEDTGGDPDELARARAEIVKLREQIKKLRVDKGVKESTTSWTDLSNVLKDAAGTFSELGNIIPGVQGQMLAGIGSIASAAVGMANGIHAIRKAATAAEKASAILAVISAAMQVVQFFTSALKENQEANLKTAKATHSYEEALEDLEEISNKAKNSTIFGDDPFGSVSKSAENAQKHLADLSSSLDNISLFSEDDLVDFTMKSSGWSTFSKKYRDAVRKMRDIGSTALVSDNRSGWQKFWGTGNDNIIVEDLTNFIGEDGNLKGEELKAWYEAYGEGLSEENKQIVEGLIHDWDDYASAMEEVTSYVKSIFGDMSSQIADSMIESWQKTGNAIADTKKILGDYAKTFAKSMIESMLVQQVFTDDVQQQMADLMSAGDTDGALALTSKLLDQANALAPQINEYLNGVNDMTGGALKGDAESTRESVSKGIAQASQDSVDELNGRMTTVQSHTFSINERVGTIVNLTSQILAKVTSIDGHTARLETIETNTANMADYLSDILTRGITVK